MKTLPIQDQRNINLFFGKRNQTTLQKFDSLSHQLRRSRTGTLDFLITHYEWFQNNRSEVVRWISPFDSPRFNMRCSRNFRRGTKGTRKDSRERLKKRSPETTPLRDPFRWRTTICFLGKGIRPLCKSLIPCPTNSDDPERVLWISWSRTMNGSRTTVVRCSDEYHHSTHQGWIWDA